MFSSLATKCIWVVTSPWTFAPSTRQDAERMATLVAHQVGRLSCNPVNAGSSHFNSVGFTTALTSKAGKWPALVIQVHGAAAEVWLFNTMINKILARKMHSIYSQSCAHEETSKSFRKNGIRATPTSWSKDVLPPCGSSKVCEHKFLQNLSSRAQLRPCSTDSSDVNVCHICNIG